MKFRKTKMLSLVLLALLFIIMSGCTRPCRNCGAGGYPTLAPIALTASANQVSTMVAGEATQAAFTPTPTP